MEANVEETTHVNEDSANVAQFTNDDTSDFGSISTSFLESSLSIVGTRSRYKNLENLVASKWPQKYTHTRVNSRNLEYTRVLLISLSAHAL